MKATGKNDTGTVHLSLAVDRSEAISLLSVLTRGAIQYYAPDDTLTDPTVLERQVSHILSRSLLDGLMGEFQAASDESKTKEQS